MRYTYRYSRILLASICYILTHSVKAKHDHRGDTRLAITAFHECVYASTLSYSVKAKHDR
jgi:hypothetical protein